MTVSKNFLHTALAACLAAVCSTGLAQQAFPSKPIRFVVPYAAGSTLDVLGRIIGPKLSDAWGQQVIVDARPGGNTVIGINAVLAAPADGYTLLLNSSGHALIPQLLNPPPYDPVKDFATVATTSSSEFILLLNPAVKANSLKELVALLKSQPGKFNYASTGVGGGPHVAGELFNVMNGVPFPAFIQPAVLFTRNRIRLIVDEACSRDDRPSRKS